MLDEFRASKNKWLNNLIGPIDIAFYDILW